MISSFQRYRRLLRYALRQWPAWAWILVLTAIAPLPVAMSPWPLKLLVDGAADATPLPPGIERIVGAIGVHDSGMTLVIVAAAASLGLFVLGSTLDAGLTFASTAAGQRMVQDLATDVFWHLQRLSLLLHRRHTIGDFLSRLTGDSWCIYTVTEAAVVAPTQHLLMLATVGIVAWRLDPVLTLTSMAIAPALAAVVVFVGPKLRRHAQLRRKTESALVSVVHQTLSSIPLAQAFCGESRNVERYHRITTTAAALGQQASLLRNAYAALLGLVAAAGTALVILTGAQRVQSGALSVGGLLVFIAYLRVLQGAVQGLLLTHGTLRTAHASVERVLEIVDSPDRITDSATATALIVPGSGIGLDLDHVTFGYEAGKPVLRDVELRVSAGQSVALVGATGAGKSTLAALVPRLIDPWQGSVRLNGRDLRELTLQSVREHVAIVPQETYLLPLSVAQNIGYGRQGGSAAEIVRAAEAAGAAEFIEELPQGYETVLGERGHTLSGGQRQRLAIARAILKNAPLLILDEPTSALDARTEHAVMGAVRRLMAGRTCLVIAHRLSTIRGADFIVVLEAGRIVELGTHEDLIARKGVYARLCDAQRIGGGYP